MACAILNTILLFLFLALLYFEAMFSTSDVHTTIQEVTSPQQTYRATLEVHDWGADSGGTNVIIEDLSTSIPVGFGRYSKLRIAYSGGWFAYRTIKLKWKDDQTLLINNKIYVVPNIHYSCFPSDFAF